MRRLLPLAWYVSLAAVFTWPLLRDPVSQLGALHGPGDPYLNLWILSWDLDTLSRAPLDVLTGRVFDAPIFHPARQTLAYSDHFIVVALLAWPVYALTHDAVVSYNVVLLASLVASALAMHWFAREVTGSSWAALAAGTVWGFWPYRFAHLGHLQLQALYAMPLVFLCLHRLVAGLRRRDALWLGIAAAFQAATSVYYGVIGTVGLGVSLVALTFATGGRRAGRLAGRLALAGVVGGILVAPLVWPYLQVQEREGFARNLFEAARHAAIPASYVSAPAVNALYGRTGWLDTDRGAESELFPGFAVVALAIAGLLSARRQGSWAVALAAASVAAAGFLLSLGPDGVRPVYAAFHDWVFGFQAIRAPARFAVLVTFGLATLAALAMRDIAARTRAGTWLCAAIVTLIAIEYWTVPGRWAPAPATATRAGTWLAEAPLPGAVVYLPLANDLENTEFMVEAVTHRRPIVNGYSGQRPAFFSGAVDALHTFPSADAFWKLEDLNVRYIVSPQPVDTAAWPVVERAHVREADGRERWVYERVWSPEVEARLGEPATPVPPAAGPAPFAAGERLVYGVTWDGPAGTVEAGTVVIETARAGEGWRFTLAARTADWVARFFEADDRFVTVTDAALLPLRHERRLREGRRRVDQVVVFDAGAQQAQIQQADGTAVGPPVRLRPHTRDALAAAFYARTLALEPGEEVVLPILENGRYSTARLIPRAVEQVQVPSGTTEALRVDVVIEQRVQRRRPPEITVWLAREGARRLVAARMGAVFGNLRVELRADS